MLIGCFPLNEKRQMVPAFAEIIVKPVGIAVNHGQSQATRRSIGQRQRLVFGNSSQGIEGLAGIGKRQLCLRMAAINLDFQYQVNGFLMGRWPPVNNDIAQGLIEKEVKTQNLLCRDVVLATDLLEPFRSKSDIVCACPKGELSTNSCHKRFHDNYWVAACSASLMSLNIGMSVAIPVNSSVLATVTCSPTKHTIMAQQINFLSMPYGKLQINNGLQM